MRGDALLTSYISRNVYISFSLEVLSGTHIREKDKYFENIAIG